MATLADALRQTGYVQDNQPVPQPSTGMAEMLRQHIASIPQKFEENQANQMAALQRAFPDNTLANADPHAMAEYAMQVPLTGMVAYHGTPHNILGKFDISKVGTGEGAQAYGHGMYFAENPAVANEYKNIEAVGGPLPSARRTLNGKELEVGSPEYHAGTLLSRNGMTLKRARDMVKSWIANPEKSFADEKMVKGWEKTLDTLNSVSKKSAFGELPHEGNLYKVDIPDEYIPNMLDWDKPLHEQSAEVKKALANVPHRGKDWTFKDTIESLEAAPHLREDVALNPTGSQIYSLLGDSMMVGNKAPGQVEASKKLNELGIKGIKYLDEGSRGLKTGIGHNAPKYTAYDPSFGGHDFNSLKEAEDFVKDNPSFNLIKPTSNFVVFDPSEVQILEKNSQPVSRKEILTKEANKLLK